MAEALDGETVRLLRLAGTVARGVGLPLYLVGGSVRDLALGLPVADLDLVVEGDASVLAHELAKALSGQVVAWSQFGTAKLRANGSTLDLVTARAESYRRPGALPTVRPGTLREDLLRRDFTINSLAMDLGEEPFGEVLDPTGGLEDLRLRLVRVLHERSFIDDATRILRALRYEQRLGFRLEEATERLLRRDLSYLDTISSDRLRHELERTLAEEKAALVLRRCLELGVLEAIHPSLRHAKDTLDVLERAPTAQAGPSPLFWMAALAYHVTPAERLSLAARLNLTARQRRVVEDAGRVRKMEPQLHRSLAPSQVDGLLRELAPEAVEVGAILAQEPGVRELLGRYLREWRRVRPALNGRDMLGLGVPQGPMVGELLEELRRARLDGQVTSRAEEEALVREHMGWRLGAS